MTRQMLLRRRLKTINRRRTQNRVGVNIAKEKTKDNEASFEK
jgi:hypothetical protein